MRLLGRRSGLLYAAGRSETVAAKAARFGLVSAWGLAGLTDSFGANTLTNLNTVTFVAGKVGNAASFAAASSQQLRAGDTASISTGAVDFLASIWVNMTTKPANSGLMCKFVGSSGAGEWLLVYNGGATDRFRMQIWSGGVQKGVVAANNLGSPATGTWYHVVGCHRNGVEVGIAVNGSVFEWSATTGSPVDTTDPFFIGGLTDESYLDGLADAAYFHKFASGGLSRALAAEIASYEYNATAGREYPAGWT